MKRDIWKLFSAVIVAGACYCYLLFHPSLTVTYDFSAYYCAFQLFRQNVNPYDAQALGVCEQQLGRIETFGSAQMWYGPWMFVLMSPVLALPYSAASAAWFLLNICFLLLAGFFSWRTVNRESMPTVPLLLSSILFFPNVEALAWNQVGPFIAVGLAGFLVAQQHEKDVRAGLWLLPCALKPHLFYLFCPVFLWWIFQQRRYKPLTTFCFALLLLVLCAEFVFPGVNLHWLSNLQAPPLVQKTPTLVGIIRGAIYDTAGYAPLWPALVVPSGALGAVLLWLAVKRPRVAWSDIIVPLLCCSLFFAPYAFVHDQCMLLIGQAMLIGAAYRLQVSAPHRKKVVVACATLQIITFALAAFVFSTTPSFFWFPAAMLGVWCFCMGPLRNDLAHDCDKTE